MRVFKTAWFRKFARKQRISDGALCEAVARAEAGLIGADLGGDLIKQRVARPGAGRSGGYRTILVFRAEARAVFVFGFTKSGQDNIEANDEKDLKKLAKLTLGFTDGEMDRLIAAGKFDEVACDGKGADEGLPK